MRFTAWFFIFSFALNLFAETGGGDCAGFSVNAVASLHTSCGPAFNARPADAEGFDLCDEACHFGHCHHLVLPAAVAKIYTGNPDRGFYFSPAALLWRPFAPLFKPPIV